MIHSGPRCPHNLRCLTEANSSNTHHGKWKHVPEQEKAKKEERRWEVGLQKARCAIKAAVGRESIAFWSMMKVDLQEKLVLVISRGRNGNLGVRVI